MSYDARTLCAVCAWRGTCAKKYSLEGLSKLHCPDFSRDASLKFDDEGGESTAEAKPDRHKKVVDVFGDGGDDE